MYLANVTDVQEHSVEGGGVFVRWLIDDEVGAPNFAMRIFTLKPGASTPHHRHPWEHEVFILSGRGVVVGGDERREFGPEHAILIPPNEAHQFRNTGSADVRFICLIPNEGKCGWIPEESQ
ncbi:MAG: cupin domain-containing protein [Armatimonadota bacterium]